MKTIITAILFFTTLCITAQPSIEWQKSLGGTDGDAAYSIQQTTDGGYIVAGESLSSDGDVTGNHGGGADFWIVKLSPTVGVDKILLPTILSIFPNPIQQYLSIESQERLQSIHLFDLKGSLIQYKEVNGFKVNISTNQLEIGVYLCKIITESRAVYCEKVVKK